MEESVDIYQHVYLVHFAAAVAAGTAAEATAAKAGEVARC